MCVCSLSPPNTLPSRAAALFLKLPYPVPTHREPNRGTSFSYPPVIRPAKTKEKGGGNKGKSKGKGAGTEEPVLYILQKPQKIKVCIIFYF